MNYLFIYVHIFPDLLCDGVCSLAAIQQKKGFSGYSEFLKRSPQQAPSSLNPGKTRSWRRSQCELVVHSKGTDGPAEPTWYSHNTKNISLETMCKKKEKNGALQNKVQLDCFSSTDLK